MTFNDLNLNTPLRNAIEDAGLETPTTIQHKAFPLVMSGKDLVGIAQTGTGKTFAYILPLLRLHKFSKKKAPSVLIIVPTRELVIQVAGEVEKMAEYMTLRVLGIYGGANINTQKERVYEGCDILVATPGRLIDIALDGVLNLKSIKRLVIDEVDEMLELGFRHQLNTLFSLLPERRQNLLFSATISESVSELIEEFFNTPQRVEAAPNGTPVEKIEQVAYGVPNFNTKFNLLKLLLEENDDMNKVLVFASSKRLADRIYKRVEEAFPERFGVIHGNKAQNQRINAVLNFKTGELRGLIATDIIARGIDIDDVSHVINFDLPENSEHYIHRIGRTGRADRNGSAISFISEKEHTFQRGIEALMQKEIPMKGNPENLEISEELIDLEKTVIAEVTLKKKDPRQNPDGSAYHEKKDKNQKVNLGSSLKRKAKDKMRRKKLKRRKKK